MRSKRSVISLFSALVISGLVMGSTLAQRYEPLPLAKIHYKLGNMHSVRGNINGALIEYFKAIDIDPQFAEAYNNVGYVHKQKGNIDLAMVYYNKALSIDPRSDTAYTNLASCYECKKDYDKAIEMFQEALKIDTGSITVELALEKVMMAKARTEGKSFEQVKEEVAALYPCKKTQPSYDQYLDLLKETAEEENTESKPDVSKETKVIEEVKIEEKVTESIDKSSNSVKPSVDIIEEEIIKEKTTESANNGSKMNLEVIDIEEIINRNQEVETQKSNEAEQKKDKNKA